MLKDIPNPMNLRNSARVTPKVPPRPLESSRGFGGPDPAGTVPAVPRAEVDVANALSVLRPTLGDSAPVALYRLLRLVALEDIIGRGAAGTAYIAGKKLGLALGLTKLEAFLDLCASLKIGVIKVPVLTETQIHVDVYECITCSGMKTVGRTLCHFEGGMIAGAVESILKKRTRAHEVTCIGGLGHDSCGFDLEFR